MATFVLESDRIKQQVAEDAQSEPAVKTSKARRERRLVTPNLIEPLAVFGMAGGSRYERL